MGPPLLLASSMLDDFGDQQEGLGGSGSDKNKISMDGVGSVRSVGYHILHPTETSGWRGRDELALPDSAATNTHKANHPSFYVSRPSASAVPSNFPFRSKQLTLL